MEINTSKLRTIIREYIDRSLLEKKKATPEWMEKNYDRANRELFGGKLGSCKFETAPLGMNTLGRFKLDVPSGCLYIDRRANNHMYAVPYIGSDKIYINKENFVKYCNPTILMNSSFSGIEESLYNTLVHEMCHYYTYMYGFAPLQGHGRDFRDIASIVSYRSNNTISIQRLASAEEMEGYEMDADLKAKKDKLAASKLARKEKQKCSTNYYVVVRNNGELRLVKTDSQTNVDNIVRHEHTLGNKVYHVNDVNISTELYNSGYKSVSRGYKYWPISANNKIINKALNASDTEEL